MTMKSHALRLAEKGFWVFRLGQNSKTPLEKGWQQEATRDATKISNLWDAAPNANIGIFTEKFEHDKALIAVDEDNKDGRNGADALFQLDFAGKNFPGTFVQTTVTGGRHHVYISGRPVKQGSNVLAPGLDIRSRGGYIVGSGSVLQGQAYSDNDCGLAGAPDWLVSKLTVTFDDRPKKPVDTSKINPALATQRALEYLALEAPIPEAGSRNETAYRVACQVKDRGVLEDECHALMADWNAMLDDPLEDEELAITVRSAYKTGSSPVGSAAPEVLFDNVEKKKPEPEKEEQAPHPFGLLNDCYSLVLAGGGHHILWETTDVKGNFKLEHLQEASFHKKFAWYQMVTDGGEQAPVTKRWLGDQHGCRRYDGLVFAPGRKVNPRFYNMWRGFAYELPKEGEEFSTAAIRSLELFNEHALVNVSGGDEIQCGYLMKYFAHMVQRPYEKPLVALVFKGEKGVGKNALVQRVACLLGSHAMVTSKKRYLTSNFNGHMENLLFFILDEAFWSGDKEAEGVLKDMITGTTHTIERKNQEPYDVDNLTRLAILGNEKWIVPASDDDRRYAVYAVGNGRKQDIKFFTDMREGMEQGGYKLLLQQLMNIDLRGFEINRAPASHALTEQKLASLEPFGQWWLDVLTTGQLIGSSVTSPDWARLPAAVVRDAFSNYARSRQIRTRLPDERSIAEDLNRFAVSMYRVKDDEGNFWYVTPGGFERLRLDWDRFIKGKMKWNASELECLS